MKKCCHCKIEKPVEAFNKNRSANDGLAFECRECMKAYRARHRATKGDAVRAADRARFHTAGRKAVIARYQSSAKGREARARANANWRSEHPDRVRASTAVNNALQSGRIQRLPCIICGSRRVEGHHPDYSRPLDVVWLCVKHHKQTHLLAAECAA